MHSATKHNSMFDYYFTDGTTLKTMIRSNPGLMLLKKGKVEAMWYYNDFPTFDEVKPNTCQSKFRQFLNGALFLKRKIALEKIPRSLLAEQEL